MINPKWLEAAKGVDPNYEGSIFQLLGFDARLCPVCNAHLRQGICLNNCHLNPLIRNKEPGTSGPIEPARQDKSGDSDSVNHNKHRENSLEPLAFEICTSQGYKLVEIVDYIEGTRNSRYQVVDPDNNPVGCHYHKIHNAYMLFRSLTKSL